MAGVSIVIEAKNAASATFDRVKGDVKNLAEDTQKATSGMKAAHEAVAKAMRGDLVGAAQSAASAFKSLWAVVISNPILLGLAAAASAIALIAKHHIEAANAARQQAEEEKQLNETLAGIRGHDPSSVRREIAAGMAERGDKAGLEAMRDKYREEVDDAERAARSLGSGSLQEVQISRMKAAQEALDIYSAALDKLAAKEAKAAENTAKLAAKEKEELAKIAAEKLKIEENALAAINEAQAEALEESLKAAEEQLKAERQARKEAAEQAVKDAEDAAKAAAEAYQKAKTEAEESFRRATDNEYRRQQEKKEKDESRAAEKAARAYEVALEKSKKGIRGKHIDAALKATADSFKELEALDNQIRAQDAQAQAEKELNDAVLATAWNTKTIADKIEDSLKPA
jgi:myosin heavy subunit